MHKPVHEAFLTAIRAIQDKHGATGRQRDLAAHFLVGCMSVYLSTNAAKNILGSFEDYHNSGRYKET